MPILERGPSPKNGFQATVSRFAAQGREGLVSGFGLEGFLNHLSDGLTEGRDAFVEGG